MWAFVELTYKGILSSECIGEYPNLDIRVEVQVNFEYKTKIGDKSKIYIPQLNFEVQLYSAPASSLSSPFSNHNFEKIGSLGVFRSSPMFFDTSKKFDTSVLIPLNAKKIEEMQKIRTSNKLVTFQITAEGIYSIYDHNDKKYSEFQPIGKAFVMKTMPDGTKNHFIILTTEEFENMFQSIKDFDIYRLEIFISRKIKSSAQEDLKRAIESMENGKDKLIQLNYQGALLDIRNAILNHLCDKENNRNVLKKEIRDYVLQRVPIDCRNMYEEILNTVSTQLNSLLQNLHKFVHEDSGKLKFSPLHQDIAMIYFITSWIIKYLASYE